MEWQLWLIAGSAVIGGELISIIVVYICAKFAGITGVTLGEASHLGGALATTSVLAGLLMELLLKLSPIGLIVVVIFLIWGWVFWVKRVLRASGKEAAKFTFCGLVLLGIPVTVLASWLISHSWTW